MRGVRATSHPASEDTPGGHRGAPTPGVCSGSATPTSLDPCKREARCFTPFSLWQDHEQTVPLCTRASHPLRCERYCFVEG